MGWGLGSFLESVVGKENVDAGRKLWNRTAEGVDEATTGLGNVANDAADYAIQKAKEVEAYRQNNLTLQKEGKAWHDKDLVRAAADQLDKVGAHFSPQERAVRAEEERKMHYFQKDPGKQALKETSADFAPLAFAMSKGYKSGMKPLVEASSEKVGKVSAMETGKQVVPEGLGKIIGKGNFNATKTFTPTHPATLAKQQATRDKFAADAIANQESIDYAINAARIKQALPGQKEYMREVIATTVNPKPYLEEMARRKAASDVRFYGAAG